MKLLEVLIAAAVGTLLLWVLVRAGSTLIAAATALDARVVATRSLDRLADRLGSDSALAWSIFVPPSDLLGNANADGHEVDIESQDAQHARFRWAYLFAGGTQRVTLYADTTTGLRVADVFSGITAFRAEVHPIGDLSDPRSTVFDPLLAGSGAPAVAYDYGWSPSAAVGGNALARIVIAASGSARTLLLASATAPSGYHVVVEYTPGP